LQRWTLGVTSMAAFMAGMDALVVTTARPAIHADLGAATSALSWTVAACALGFDRRRARGRRARRPLWAAAGVLTGLALFTLGSAGCALSPNVGLLIATRAIPGVGGLVLAGATMTSPQ
jgi:MFS family permease